MTPLFLLPAARSHDPGIDAWLNRHADARGALAQHWFARLRALGEDVREILHDGHPTVCVSEAALAYVAVFTAHVNLGFFQGAELPDPAGLLQGRGRSMRHVKLRPGEQINADALGALIDAAYAALRARLLTGTPPSAPAPAVRPRV